MFADAVGKANDHNLVYARLSDIFTSASAFKRTHFEMAFGMTGPRVDQWNFEADPKVCSLRAALEPRIRDLLLSKKADFDKAKQLIRDIP